jgi:hypothetical protein
MTQDDLFGAASSTGANPIVGLTAKLRDRPCQKCGGVDATIESTGKGPHPGSLRCNDCGQFRGWLRKETYDFVTACIEEFGKPAKSITIRTFQSL